MHEITWLWLCGIKLKKETEYLFIAAQNNALRTNYVKEKIDNTKKNMAQSAGAVKYNNCISAEGLDFANE